MDIIREDLSVIKGCEMMKWTEVQIKTTTEAQEAVSNILYDLGVGGLSIEDPQDILDFMKSDEDWDYIDPSLIKDDFEGVIIKGYFPESEDLIDKIELIRQNIEKIPQYNSDKILGEMTVTEVYEKDWEDAWKKYYKPKKIGEKIVIKPTWEEYKKQGHDIVVEMDPGMAFGTGTHETTIMCVKMLEKHIKKDCKVFDIGCGSGILSIVSAKLGASKVIGVDLDEVSIESSNNNILLNNVENIVEIKKGNLLDGINGNADIIVANIVAEVVVTLSETIKDYLSKDGIFVASGIIGEKMEYVEKNFKKNGLEIIETEKTNDWICIAAKIGKDEIIE
jgi:ribosomal protein L11 methyltransferase